MWYVECLKNCCDAVDRTYYDAILSRDNDRQYLADRLVSFPFLTV